MGFNEIILTLNYHKAQIMHHVGDGSRFGVKISHCVEPEGLFLGTAGSVKSSSHLLDDTFLVVQGDSYTDMDLISAVKYHRKSGGEVTVVLKKVADPWLYGVAVTDAAGRITDFQEKPSPDQCLGDRISTGIYVLEPEVLDLVTPGVSCDFAKDVFPRVLTAGKKMFGYECEGFWVDIGSLEGYLQGTIRVLERLEEFMRGTVYTRLEDNVWIAHNASVDESTRILGPSLIEEEVDVGKDAHIGPRAVLKAESRVGDRTSIERAIVLEGATIGSKGNVQFSVVGEKAKLGNGLVTHRSIVAGVLNDGIHVGDSRIWPSVAVEPNSVIEGVILWTHDKPFYFKTDQDKYCGVLAISLSSLVEAFKKVEDRSLEFHLYRQDFEHWLIDVVHAPELAENIARLRRAELRGEPLRQELIKAIEEQR